jgi:hypothetical protein
LIRKRKIWVFSKTIHFFKNTPFLRCLYILRCQKKGLWRNFMWTFRKILKFKNGVAKYALVHVSLSLSRIFKICISSKHISFHYCCTHLKFDIFPDFYRQNRGGSKLTRGSSQVNLTLIETETRVQLYTQNCKICQQLCMFF